MDIIRIVPNISSHQLEASKNFYKNFLGLKLAMDMDWIMTFVSESNRSIQISIIKKEKQAPLNTDLTITIEVSDADELYAKAMALQYDIVYPITIEPWGVKRFHLKEPNGVVINIMSHIS